MAETYIASKPKQHYSQGAPLKFGPLVLYSELDFGNIATDKVQNELYISHKGGHSIIEKMRPVFGIARSFDDDYFVGRPERGLFIGAQLILRIFQEGYFFEAVSKASETIGKTLTRRAKGFLDDMIAEAWADYSGTHAQLARQLGIMH